MHLLVFTQFFSVFPLSPYSFQVVLSHFFKHLVSSLPPSSSQLKHHRVRHFSPILLLQCCSKSIALCPSHETLVAPHVAKLQLCTAGSLVFGDFLVCMLVLCLYATTQQIPILGEPVNLENLCELKPILLFICLRSLDIIYHPTP